jgi:peptide/histidine transporter 3/4
VETLLRVGTPHRVVGSYLSSLVVTVVSGITTRGGEPGWIPGNLNEGHLDRFFRLIDALSSLNLVAFVCYAKRYKCKMSNETHDRRSASKFGKS